MTADAIHRVIRTFLITFLALFIPGMLGWLNDLTQWSKEQGQIPFPDGTDLAYLGVSAIVAGVVAVVNLLWNGIEDWSGKGLLRVPPPRTKSGD